MGKRTADADEVSKRLRHLRLEKEIRSQDKLSELSGIPIISIRRYEEGITVPEGKNLLKLASFYGVDPEYILGETEYKNAFDRWNKTIDVSNIRKDIRFWETGTTLGIFPEIRSDDEAEEFMEYVKHYEERKNMTMKRESIKVMLGASENYIIVNFETGVFTIFAVSETDVEKAYQYLIRIGIINE